MSYHMPFDMQAEIMKRLPTKSLMRFRSVSKPWKSLVDSPKFIADYSFNQQHLLVRCEANHKQQKYVSLVDDDTFPLNKVSLPDPTPELFLPIILGSSQGLFCLYNNIEDSNYGWIVKTVHLWNPSIRKSVAIDVFPLQVPNSLTVIGFGVSPHTSDPKVVAVNCSYIVLKDANTTSYTYTPWQVEVYSLSSRSWRSIPTINHPRKSIGLMTNQVVLHEFIYWLAVGYVGTDEYNVIVSFDLTSEGFMLVSLPDTLARAYGNNIVISKLKESLVVIEVLNKYEHEKQVYGVWMMEDGPSNSFAKLFTINSPGASIRALLGVWK